MWKCNNCGLELNIKKITFPVYCSCGYAQDEEGNLTIISRDSKIPEDFIQTKIDGSNLWKELHSYIFTTKEAAEVFFSVWQLKIPSFGCSCREHWSKIVAEFPPDFSSECAFFKWGVDAHNKVNERLGKPIFSYEEALVMYGKNCV